MTPFEKFKDLGVERWRRERSIDLNILMTVAFKGNGITTEKISEYMRCYLARPELTEGLLKMRLDILTQEGLLTSKSFADSKMWSIDEELRMWIKMLSPMPPKKK